MITTAELHRVAGREGLRFDQVEKDFMILLILSSLSKVIVQDHPWFFKGGTCLRHCYYPGYRFSEDIDFSCTGEGEVVRQAYDLLLGVARKLTEDTGIMMRCKEPRADEDHTQIEIPIEYSRGGPRRQSLPAVKVHLSFEEPLLAPPENRPVRPSYDGMEPFTLAAYSKIEIVAEKVRALLQQQEKWPRPRDLYDLWFILCSRGETFNKSHFRSLFVEKCRIRGISPDIDRLRSKHLYEWNREAWSSQLMPMIRTAPEYDLVWSQWIVKSEELL